VTATVAGSAAAALPARELIALCQGALADVRVHVAAAHRNLAAAVAPEGRLDRKRLHEHQFAAHGYAWTAAYGQALAALLGWAEGLEAGGRLGELERLILQAGFGGYLAQLAHGIAMSQDEVVRPGDLGLAPGATLAGPATLRLIAVGNSVGLRLAIAALLREGGTFGDTGLDGEHAMMRAEFRRFADAKVVPHAQDWHRADALIPLELIEEMAALGVFGVTVPAEWGGLGLDKVAMCVVTEELCRGYLTVGSLSTRSDIAAELIDKAGTAGQKQRWLAAIAAGKVLPAAAFTEPDTGSDLASVRTRATRDGAGWRISGAKTWSTHAARADMLTLLARTGAQEDGFRGISMFLVEKPRGTVDDPFPAAGMSGTEIPVLGYRGMKDYEIAFDGYAQPREALLGEVEGEGFRQLMTTFETARIQTGARAIGVAQSALELGLDYAMQRRQFGRPIADYQRIAGKLGWAAVEVMTVRQLVHHAAREKNSGRRCDIVAGMAKLVGARVAWSAADNAVQIHGGNGYAEEYPVSRVLCDARILNIFEGAAEIQADIIARGLLGREGAN